MEVGKERGSVTGVLLRFVHVMLPVMAHTSNFVTFAVAYEKLRELSLCTSVSYVP